MKINFCSSGQGATGCYIYMRTRFPQNAFIYVACNDIGLAVNIGKTKYLEIGHDRGMIANAHIKIGSNSYEN